MQASYKLPLDDLSFILEKTSQCFSQFKNQNILLTGGTGFFGKWFLECFAYARENGLFEGKLFVLSRSPETFLTEFPHFKSHEIEWIKGDTSQFELDTPIHFIIHMAADISLNTSGQGISHFKKNVATVERISNLAKRFSSRLLLVSSGAVEVSSSWNPLSASTFYSETKKISELLFLDALKESSCHLTIARCYSFLGPYLPIESHYAAGNFIRDTLSQKRIVIKGTGRDLRSYMYPTDLVIWLLHIICLGNQQSIYAIGSEEKISLAALASLIDQKGAQQGTVVLGEDRVGLAPTAYFPDTTTIRRDLNLEIYTDLNMAIEKTLAWHLRNKNA